MMLTPRGGLMTLAQGRMQELRNSLAPATDVIWRTRPMMVPFATIPDFPADCRDRRGEIKKKCLKD